MAKRLTTISGRGRALVPKSGRRSAPAINLPEVRRATRSVYVSDHPDLRTGTRLRWLVSTCLAAGVAAVAFGLVLYGSMEPDGSGENGSGTSLLEVMRNTVRIDIQTPISQTPAVRTVTGKTDRLLVVASGLTTRNIIHDSVQQQKDARTFISIKPYVRVVARLSNAGGAQDASIPSFNPLTLFAPASADATRGGAAKIKISVVDLAGGVLPTDDGQELSDSDVAAIVKDQIDGGTPSDDVAPAIVGSGADSSAAIAGNSASDGTNAPAPATIVLAKNRIDPGETEGNSSGQVRVVEIGAPGKLIDTLVQNGVQAWQGREIAQIGRAELGSELVLPGQNIRLTMAPSADGDTAELFAVSVFGEAGEHILTVARNSAGAFVASRTPALTSINNAAFADQPTNLYTSFYRSALVQGLPAPMITTMLKTFAYDTDFKRRVSPGDGFEVFYDLEGEGNSEIITQSGTSIAPRDLLFMSLTVGGETRRFYRFRLPEGGIDYFDAEGSNARKFLLRKPIRGNDVRFTSGFGFRLHPLLKVRKMHTGTDWSSASGTPILAAGNGVIEELGRKGGNGNYTRIRHANGYQTAYSHQSRYQPGLGVGSKVTQGQVIGYVGSTGLSSGPHLHFEVLINRGFVDPMTIHVPRERQLSAKALSDFQRELARIDELMSRAPVSTIVAEAKNG